MARLKQRPDGYFCAWYKGKQFLGKTEPEARRKRDDYKYEVEHGIDQIEPKSVTDYAAEWLPVAKAGCANTTYNQYATIMDKLTAFIGGKLLSAVTPMDINKLWSAFLGKSQSYINKASFLYRSFFNSAVENGYCRINPVESVSAKPHKGSRGTHRALTKAEVALIETVPHRVQAGAMFMLKAGLRRGEVLALRMSDVHDDRIIVNKAVRFANNRPVLSQTKNESSKRSVPLFAPLKPFVNDTDNLILPDTDGNLCSETAFQRAWQSYLHTLSVAAGHPVSFRPHDLRHSFVTACRNKNIDPKTVMTWCGHSSERMIMQIYDHVDNEREQRMIALMNG